MGIFKAFETKGLVSPSAFVSNFVGIAASSNEASLSNKSSARTESPIKSWAKRLLRALEAPSSSLPPKPSRLTTSLSDGGWIFRGDELPGPVGTTAVSQSLNQPVRESVSQSGRQSACELIWAERSGAEGAAIARRATSVSASSPLHKDEEEK